MGEKEQFGGIEKVAVEESARQAADGRTQA